MNWLKNFIFSKVGGIVSAILLAIISSLATKYSDEIRTYFLPSDEYIVGIWDCKWKVLSEYKNNKIIVDILKIENKIDNRIMGYGYEKRAGEYKIIGYDNEVSTTFTYHGVNSSHLNSKGSAVFSKGYNQNTLNGKWIQLVENNNTSGTYIIYGDVECMKANK